MTLTRMDFKRHAQEWIAAWNSHNLDRMLEHYSEDIELISPLVSKLTEQKVGMICGKTALREYFARGMQAFPTLQFDFIRLYSGVQSCVMEYHSVDGLRTAELMEYDAHGMVRRVLAHYSEEARKHL